MVCVWGGGEGVRGSSSLVSSQDVVVQPEEPSDMFKKNKCLGRVHG